MLGFFAHVFQRAVGEHREPTRGRKRSVDMTVDMSEESFIEVDGEKVQEDGTFVFEE